MPKLNSDGKIIRAIRLTVPEIQSGSDRVKWAEGLIRQLPEDHDGRNSWLHNYGENSTVIHVYPEQSVDSKYHRSVDEPMDYDVPFGNAESVANLLRNDRIHHSGDTRDLTTEAFKRLSKGLEIKGSLTGRIKDDAPVEQDVYDHPLFGFFVEAIQQAMYGKGERHGGCATPFLEQPWVHYAKMHGRGFLTGQAAKKLEEAASKRSGEAFKTEVLGAIVYAGMALIHEVEERFREKS